MASDRVGLPRADIGECYNCRFWRVDRHGDGTEGECRRYPPTLSHARAQLEAEHESGGDSENAADAAADWSASEYCWYFPRTDGGTWCGEYQTHPALPAPEEPTA